MVCLTEEQLCWKGYGSPGGYQLKVSQLWALAPKTANSILGCTNRNIASKVMEVIVLLYMARIRPCQDTACSSEASILERLITWSKSVGGSPRWLGLEHLRSEERLRELGFFSLGKKRHQEDLTTACQGLWGTYQGDKAGLLAWLKWDSDWMQGKKTSHCEDTTTVEQTFKRDCFLNCWRLSRLDWENSEQPGLFS